jgi:hypothetical protein
VLAKALARSGQIGHARELYTSALAGAQPPLSTDELRDYFLFERDNGSRQQAIAAYERLRDRGYDADPFGNYRLNLSYRYPTTPSKLRDLLGILALPQAPTEPWRLRHATRQPGRRRLYYQCVTCRLSSRIMVII